VFNKFGVCVLLLFRVDLSRDSRHWLPNERRHLMKSLEKVTTSWEMMRMLKVCLEILLFIRV